MGPWLLILDNADYVTMFFDPDNSTDEEELSKYIP